MYTLWCHWCTLKTFRATPINLHLIVHYKLYCDVFPFFTLFRTLSELIRLLPVSDYCCVNPSMLLWTYFILLSKTRMTIWLSTKGSVGTFLPYKFPYTNEHRAINLFTILLQADIITLFQVNSHIVVENCVVGVCNNGMFLEFHELKQNIWLAYINGIELQCMLNIC